MSVRQEKDLEFANTPNMLTLSRILLVPAVVGILFFREPLWDAIAAGIFIIAAITDYFDGYIARRQKIITVYGELLDPLADKFLVVSCLVMLQHLGRVHPVAVMLLICRELGITGLRAVASAQGVVIPASGGGKWKTALQMSSLPCLLIYDTHFGVPLASIGTGLLYLSLTLSLWSAQDYVFGFFKGLRETRKRSRERKEAKLRAKQAARSRAGLEPSNGG